MEWQNFEKRLDGLNEEQRMAVEAIDGPTLVVAGPGSGKTEILALRVANILKKTDTLSQNILCLTFTDSASSNMRKRLFELLGESAHKIPVFTFHSFAVHIINRYPEYFYHGVSFEPADEITRTKIIDDIVKKLPHDAILSAYHPKEGYVYSRSILFAISALKRAAILPKDLLKIIDDNNKCYLEINKKISPIFSERISLKIIDAIHKAFPGNSIHSPKTKDETSFHHIFQSSLSKALISAEAEKSTKPITLWKEKWLGKDDGNKAVLRSSLSGLKLMELYNIYSSYRESMHTAGYFDFDDMLVDVVEALKKYKNLRFDLAETFQYVLIDEFQDTNDAQFKLVREIFSIAESIGNPNIMVVGDDDQAVYKFQGAELSNILDFIRIYPSTKVIVLKKNYRSTQNILDVSRGVILQASERLENTVEGIEKDLLSMSGKGGNGDVEWREFSTVTHELSFVAREIIKLEKSGIKFSNIAVISRKHRELAELVTLLRRNKIPINYERQVDVLGLPHIKQIITIVTYIESLFSPNEKDELLPEILLFPFWGLEKIDVWRIANQAKKNGKKWIEVMLQSTGKIKVVGDFLINGGAFGKSQGLEEFLDYIIGSYQSKKRVSNKIFRSPFREYYFGKKKLGESQDMYIHFLSSLRVFIESIRAYRSGKDIYIKDLVEFVELHKKNNIAIFDNTKLIEKESSVSLMTAHKAKGMEFEVVFVLNCNESNWLGRGMGTKISFPENLQILPSGDTFDDKVRLLYVAMTRAKKKIYFLSSLTNPLGKELRNIEFLSAILNDNKIEDRHKLDQNDMILDSSNENSYLTGFTKKESSFLRGIVDDYILNVTHLNNFLDVSKNGPEYFFNMNLLRFPQASSGSIKYGSAIHKTIENIYHHTKANNEIPDVKEVLDVFMATLHSKHLDKDSYKKYLDRGNKNLKIYYERNKDNFKKKAIVEMDFKDENVMIGEARITGKIDRIDVEDVDVEVVDIKTGSILRSFDDKKDTFNKGIMYRRQLMFYKILIENSRTVSHLLVKTGKLEFIEAKNTLECVLAMEFNNDEVERLQSLIKIVYQKIRSLDFPDVSQYANMPDGHRQFEDDLISGKI